MEGANRHSTGSHHGGSTASHNNMQYKRMPRIRRTQEIKGTGKKVGGIVADVSAWQYQSDVGGRYLNKDGTEEVIETRLQKLAKVQPLAVMKAASAFGTVMKKQKGNKAVAGKGFSRQMSMLSSMKVAMSKGRIVFFMS